MSCTWTTEQLPRTLPLPAVEEDKRYGDSSAELKVHAEGPNGDRLQ